MASSGTSNIKSIESDSIYTQEHMPSNPTLKDIQEIEIEKLKIKIPQTLDNLKFSKFHLWVIIALGVSWVLDGYEVSLLNVLSGVLKQTFSMDDSEIGLAGSLYLLGCVSGSLFFGYLAAKWGRKMLFTVTLGIYVISILATSIAPNKYIFFLCRYFTGVSVGGEYSSIFAAIDELIPPSIRGRADLIIDGTWHLGSSIASIISYLTLTTFPSYQDFIIRFLFILGVILALPVIYLRKNIPESPRWLIYRGKYKDAMNILEQIESQCTSKSYYSYSGFKESDTETARLVGTLKMKSEKSHVEIKNQNLEEISFKEIFNTLVNKHRIRFFYALVLMASQAFFYNGIFYTYALILQNFYSIKKEHVGIYLIPLSLASFLGPLVIGQYFDSWSRRKMIGLTYCLSGVMLTITAINFVTNKFNFTIQQILWFITFFIASPAASSAHLTVSEIFPIEMRSQAMAIFFSFGLGAGGVIAPFLFGSFVQQDNKKTIFFSYLLAACIMISAGIFGFLKGVDAENKPLEEISKNIRDEKIESEEGNAKNNFEKI